MFYDRYKEVCIKNGYNPQSTALVKELEVSPGTISGWKQGKDPKGKTLIKIATFFNCSVDYLLGITNDSSLNACISKEEKTLIECFRTSDEIGRFKIIKEAMNEMERSERECPKENKCITG